MLLQRKKIWYAKIYAAPGRAVWRCLHTGSKADAKLVHDRMMDEAKEIRHKAKFDELLESKSLLEKKRAKDLGPTLERIKPMAHDVKPLDGRTCEDLARFIAWLRERESRCLRASQIAAQTAFAYMQEKYSTAAPKTYNNVRSRLSGVFSRLAIYDVPNPFEGIPHRSVDSVHYRAFSREETDKILAAAPPLWKELVTLGLYTGMRRSDCVFLRWDEVKADHIERKPNKTRKKNNLAVWIPLRLEAKAALYAMPRDGDCVFPESFRNTYDTGVFNAVFPELLASLDIKSNTIGKASFHSLRSTFITRCEEGGVSRKVLQGIVGHSSPAMTSRYSEDHESAKTILSVKI